MQEYILSPLGLRNYFTTDTMSKTTSLPKVSFAENLVIFIRNRKVVKALANYSFYYCYVVFLWELRNAGKNLVPAWL